MMEKPEFAALQNLSYDGTPEEQCRNFRNHAMESLDMILKKYTKNHKHDEVECERAMHFFNEAFKTGWKEYQSTFTLYMGRAKLNLLIGQFGKCKEDALEALKIKPDSPQMWLILSRSRFFVEKWQEGLKYTMQGLEKFPDDKKLLSMKESYE
jgi:tetratricopeptide (TPR) repeat protein